MTIINDTHISTNKPTMEKKQKKQMTFLLLMSNAILKQFINKKYLKVL